MSGKFRIVTGDLCQVRTIAGLLLKLPTSAAISHFRASCFADGKDKKSAPVPTPRRDSAAWAINKNNNTVLYIFGGFGTGSSSASPFLRSFSLQPNRTQSRSKLLTE
jgi:hypothetical protein